MVTDENDGDQMLVYYSLGNFVNGTESTTGTLADRMVGGIAEVNIGYTSDGSVGITSYDVAPIVCHMDMALTIPCTIWMTTRRILQRRTAYWIRTPHSVLTTAGSLCRMCGGSDSSPNRS